MCAVSDQILPTLTLHTSSSADYAQLLLRLQYSGSILLQLLHTPLCSCMLLCHNFTSRHCQWRGIVMPCRCLP